jgi:threonine synthase
MEQGLVGADERVVLFNCATGLKYPLADQSRTLSKAGPIDHGSL